MIRVMIVDDQRLMRDGLKTLLSLEEDIEIVTLASNGEEAVHMIRDVSVDIVLMDIRMPLKNGIEATSEITQKHRGVKVLILTTFEEQNEVVDALSAGAVGYLLKDMPAEEIADAIRTANSGGAVLPPNIAKTFLSAVQKNPPTDYLSGAATTPTSSSTTTPNNHGGFSSSISSKPVGGLDTNIRELLTEREVDVLHCLAKGMSNREISDALFVTEGTVKNHVSNLISKLNLRDRTQVALYAVRSGYGGEDRG